jgi:hypothetical protein
MLTKRKSMPLKPGVALLAVMLGGCASALDTYGDPFVQPGKFNFLRCQDIAERVATAEKREQELRSLMSRADSGVGGGAVNLFVYKPDLQGVQADLRLLRKTAGEKRCDSTPTAAAATGSNADSKTDAKTDQANSPNGNPKTVPKN